MADVPVEHRFSLLGTRTAMNKDYVQHLEMIEKVVGRLAGNSFKYKGWSLILVSALLALSAKDLHPGYALIALLPAFCFWWLDAYYLRQERLFRRLFEEVRLKGIAAGVPPATPADFSMQTSPPPPGDPDAQKYSLASVAFSATIAWLHIPLLLVTAAVTVILWIVR